MRCEQAKSWITNPTSIPTTQSHTSQNQDNGRDKNPETESVQAWEGHVRSANHQRDQIVEHRANAQQNTGNHDNAMPAKQGVVAIESQPLHTWLGKFNTEHDRE